MGNGITFKDGYEIHAKPEHFEKGYNICANGKFSKEQAMIMAKGFSKKCLIDASEGCMYYVLTLICNKV